MLAFAQQSRDLILAELLPDCRDAYPLDVLGALRSSSRPRSAT